MVGGTKPLHRTVLWAARGAGSETHSSSVRNPPERGFHAQCLLHSMGSTPIHTSPAESTIAELTSAHSAQKPRGTQTAFSTWTFQLPLSLNCVLSSLFSKLVYYANIVV